MQAAAIENLLTGMGKDAGKVHYRLPVETLIRQTLELQQGVLSDSGALCVNTGRFTGRWPKNVNPTECIPRSPF